MTGLQARGKISTHSVSLSLNRTGGCVGGVRGGGSLPTVRSFFCVYRCLNIAPRRFFSRKGACPRALGRFVTRTERLSPRSVRCVLNVVGRLGDEGWTIAMVTTFFIAFFVVFCGILRVSTPCASGCSGAILRATFFCSPMLPGLPIPHSIPESIAGSTVAVNIVADYPVQTPLGESYT